MDPAKLRISKGGFPVTSLTVDGHESVIQKFVKPCSPSSQDIRERKKKGSTANTTNNNNKRPAEIIFLTLG